MPKLIGSKKIDDAMRERWYELHLKHGLIPRLIATRFDVNVYTVSKYLKERREREGVGKPQRTDTVTIKGLPSQASRL